MTEEKKRAKQCVICGRTYDFHWGLNTCSASCWEKAATPDDVRIVSEFLFGKARAGKAGA